MELTSLNAIGQSEKYIKYEQIIRRQTHCVNGTLLAHVVFAKRSEEKEDSATASTAGGFTWDESINQVCEILTLPELLTVDNVNSLILVKQIYIGQQVERDINVSVYTPEIEEVICIRMSQLKTHFETRKKSSRQEVINALIKKYGDRIQTINQCVEHFNCLVDFEILTNKGKKIAIIAVNKL